MTLPFQNMKFYSETNYGSFVSTDLLTKDFKTIQQDTLFVPKKNPIKLSAQKSIKQKENGFLIEILFHGFNFSAKRLKLFRSKYYLDTHKSEIFICDEPVASTFKSKVFKRRLIFFSFDRDLINNIGKAIKQFKKPDAYTGKGLFERNDSYIIKQRKKRK